MMELMSLKFTLIQPDDVILNYMTDVGGNSMVKALHQGAPPYGTYLRPYGVLNVESPSNSPLGDVVILIENSSSKLIYVGINRAVTGGGVIWTFRPDDGSCHVGFAEEQSVSGDEGY